MRGERSGAAVLCLCVGWAAACGAKSGLSEPTADASVVVDAASEDAGGEPPDVELDAGTDPQPEDGPPPSCVAGVPVVPWAWTAGGVESESAYALALGAEGSVYVVGTFAGSVDFGLEQLSAADRLDVFVQKLGCDGEPLWARRFGGLDSKGPSSGWGDEGGAVAVTPSGAVLAGGQYCQSVDFDPGPGDATKQAQSCFDGFVVSLDAQGNYQWVATFGGSGRDRVGGIAVAPDGSIYAAGQFENVVDFDPGPGQVLATSQGEIDEFLLKLSPAGELVWVRTWGGPATEYGTGHLALTSTGDIVVAGQFSGTADFDPGPGADPRTASGSDDAFVMAFAPSGERLWARTFGGASYEGVGAVVVGSDDAVYVTGSFYGPADFDPGPGSDVRANSGLYDAYLVRLGADGAYHWTRTWGAASSASAPQNMVAGNALARAADGTIAVAGSFQGQIDFDPGAGSDARSSVTLDAYDAFVSVFSPSGDASGWWTFGGAAGDGAHAIAAHGSRWVAAGGFAGSVELAPKPFPGGLSHSAVGERDVFVAHW